MKLLIVLLGLLTISSAYSADIVTYENKEKGERTIRILNSEDINLFEYDEDDKRLNITMDQYGFNFKIESYEAAVVILDRLRDRNDNALIELEKY